MVCVDQIEARAAVLALAERTVVQILGARLAAPSLLALALEAARRIVAGMRIDARAQAFHIVVAVVALVEVCTQKLGVTRSV